MPWVTATSSPNVGGGLGRRGDPRQGGRGRGGPRRGRPRPAGAGRRAAALLQAVRAPGPTAGRHLAGAGVDRDRGRRGRGGRRGWRRLRHAAAVSARPARAARRASGGGPPDHAHAPGHVARHVSAITSRRLGRAGRAGRRTPTTGRRTGHEAAPVERDAHLTDRTVVWWRARARPGATPVPQQHEQARPVGVEAGHPGAVGRIGPRGPQVEGAVVGEGGAQVGRAGGRPGREAPLAQQQRGGREWAVAAEGPGGAGPLRVGGDVGRPPGRAAARRRPSPTISRVCAPRRSTSRPPTSGGPARVAGRGDAAVGHREGRRSRRSAREDAAARRRPASVTRATRRYGAPSAVRGRRRSRALLRAAGAEARHLPATPPVRSPLQGDGRRHAAGGEATRG